MPADRHDWREHLGGYPWPDVDLPCREDPDRFDGLHEAKGVEPPTDHCDPCPVRRSCLAYALEWRINDGTWGGTTGSQRVKTLRDLRRRYRS